MEGFEIDDADEFGAWLASERSALAADWRRACRAVLREAANAGLHDEALHLADLLVRADPLDEQATCDAMRVAAGMGDLRGATVRFTALAKRLADELGMAPDPATVALHQRLRGCAGALGARDAAEPVAAAIAESMGAPRAPSVADPPDAATPGAHRGVLGWGAIRFGLAGSAPGPLVPPFHAGFTLTSLAVLYPRGGGCDMTRHPLRSTLGTSFFVAILALANMIVAADYPGPYFDQGNGGGAAVVQAPGWSDLMGVLEACAAGHDCTITVARGDQTFYWTAYGPLLALSDTEAIVDEADEPARATGGGGGGALYVAPGVPAHKLMP